MENTEQLLKEALTKLDNLTKLVQRQDRLVTKMAKALHLVPVTEKEEQELQIMRRNNEKLRYQVNDELDAMQNKPKGDDLQGVALGNLFSTPEDVYSDVLGEDMLNEVYNK